MSRTLNGATCINGTMVTERRDDTILIRLPRDHWSLIEDGCKCDVCETSGRAPYWDTMAVRKTKPAKGNDYVWTVHHPLPEAHETFTVFEIDGTRSTYQCRRPEGPGYWTVIIPWSATPTEWHPTERTGPFAVLSRGSFKTETAARIWARDKLCCQPYTLQFHCMPDEAALIRETCAEQGSYVISETGPMHPSRVLPKLLETLLALDPAAHQQVTAPGCGFALIPSYALDDESHDWWNGEDAASALNAIIEALNENAPTGFVFTAEGDWSRLGFYRLPADE